MKKLLSIIFALLMMFTASLSAGAATNTLDFKWQYYNGGTIFDGYEVYGITDFGKSETEYVIPEKYAGTKVVAIADDSFVNFTQIKSLSMSNNYLFSIGDRAFKGCTNLATATLSTKLTYLGESAFEGCSSLKSITIPSGVKVIKANTFKGCTALETVVLPSTVTTIESGAFSGCTSLKNITIPASLTTLGNGAFQDCASLESAAIPAGVSLIADNAFSGCSALKTLTMAKVVKIGEKAFYGCTALENITFSSNLYEIGNSAFESCTSIKTLSLPESISTIGEEAFYKCSSIESLTFPDGLREIKFSAFTNCTALKSVVMSDTITTVGEAVFLGCNNLTSIKISKMLYTINRDFIDGKIDNLVIPEGVSVIKKGAFYPAVFTNVSLPSTLKEVENPREFYGARSLKYAGTAEEFEELGLEFNYLEKEDIQFFVCSETGETHDIDSNTIVVYEPTCSAEGLKRNDCKNCRYAVKQYTPIDPNNHPYGRWITVKEATCTAKGQERYTCSCGNYDVYRDIALKNHSFIHNTEAATCTTGRADVKTCYYCGHTERNYVSDALGHNDNNHDGRCDRCNEDTTKNCKHICHKNNFFYKIALFFWKLFKINKECSCGIYHY